MTGGDAKSALAGRPVFVTGLGLVSTLGPTLDTAVRRLSQGDIPQPVIREVVPGEAWPHYAIGVAHEPSATWHERARNLILQAMTECGATDDRAAPLFIASSSINIGAIEQGEESGADCLKFSERLAGWLEWEGPVFWVSTACTSAINALNSARRMIESGAAESAVVLGLEIENRYSAAGFGSMQLLSPTRTQPLSPTRDGLVLGEAVAAIRLSSHRPVAAQSLHWRLRGGANIVDGSNPAGAVESAVAAMAEQALTSSGLTAGDIDLIKLQAAGSPHNDAAEVRGLRSVFAELPALCSLKPLLGHTLGAAGAAEVALLLGCLDAGIWPPQEDAEPDPELGVRLSTCPPADKVWPRYLLAIILGFGGGHAALVLENLAGTA